MSKTSEKQYDDYDSDEMIDDEFGSVENEVEENLKLSADHFMDFRKTWRDTERYKEMRELHKLINDELYIGFNDNDFIENNF